MSACTPGLESSRKKIISVNGVAIARDDISREAQNHHAETPAAAWTEAAQALVVRQLLVQEARRLGLSPEPATDGQGRRETDEEALIRGLVEREVITPTPDEASCRRYYEQNRQKFRSSDLYEAAHILIAANPNDPKQVAEKRKSALALIEILARDPSSFADAARVYSACSSREHGGNLGQISRGQTVAEFEEGLSRLTPGFIAHEPIHTRYGFHVVRLDRKIEGEALAYELVAKRIADYLDETCRRRAVAQYIGILAGQARIDGFSLLPPKGQPLQ
jgi:peptidyl-prolyl cis-trans isomerase C